MYICNFKFNIKKVLIWVLIIAVAIALIFEISNMLSNNNKNKFDYVLDESNFTTVLKTVHDNIEENIGKSIKISGFVFKLPDFDDGYFVCGRNMMLNGDEKVVGFLCKSTEMNLSDSEWVEITGEFVKGYYITDMPVIQIKTIKKITAPVNTYVDTPNFLK